VTDCSSTTATVIGMDGSRTATISWYAGATLLSRSIITTSADGLNTVTQIDTNGDGIIDELRGDRTVINPDGTCRPRR
jgi:hypothetical protein